MKINLSNSTQDKIPNTPKKESTKYIPKFHQPVILEQSRIWSRAIIWTLMSVTTGTFIWAHLTKIEEAVSAQGQLEPTATVKEVKVPLNGVVKEIFVKDGQLVKEGDRLLTLDPTTNLAQLDSLTKIRASLKEEIQYYQSQLRGEEVSEIISNQIKNNIANKISATIPPQMLSLAKNRATIAAENRLYRAQLDGLNNGSINNRLSPEERQRLAARIAELNSRLNNVSLQGQQAQQKLKENQVQLANSINTLPSSKQALLLNEERLKNNENSLKIDQQKLVLNYSNLQISDEIVRNMESITKEGAFPVLQLRRQQQDFLTQQQNLFSQHQQILQQKQQILQQKQQILEQENTIKNIEAQTKQLAEEEKRLIFEITQYQEQFRNTAAASAEDLLSKITANDKNLAEIDTQISKVIIDNEKRVAEIDSQISQAQMNAKYQEIKAPANGTIFELKANTPGFVVAGSDSVVKIVPTDNLVAKVYITNKDIGFVKEGMKVDVRIDSFPFSEFGDIKGKLIWIGSDTLPPDQVYPFHRFPAKIQLDTQQLLTHGREINLQSGMSISTNIKTRERTVLSIFTDMFSNSMETLKTVR
jgi:hemolysin D